MGKLVGFVFKTLGMGANRSASGKPYPPSSSQKAICGRLGITVESRMTKVDVEKLIEKALQDPANKAIEAEHQRKIEEEEERDNREIYGDAVVDEYKKWKALTGKYCYVVLTRGKSRIADVAWIGWPEFPDDDKVWVSVEMSLPIVTRESRDVGSMVLWDKNITIKSTQVIRVEPLDAKIDVNTLDYPEGYLPHKARAEAIAAEL